MQKQGPKKIVVYSHDTFGLGNVRRMLAITEHLLKSIPDLSILLISGSPLIHSFRLPEDRFDYLKLPCIGRTVNGNYIAKKLGTNFDELVKVRSQIIQAAVANFSPDIMIVDKKPRGIADELQATLALIQKEMPTTDVVLLLRDILDAPQTTQKIWQKNNYYQSIEQYYRSILVMGSAKVFDICDKYQFPASICDKVEYCGYINRNQLNSESETVQLFKNTDKAKVLVTVGGGEDGILPLKYFLKGLISHQDKVHFSSVIITGPEMSGQNRKEILQLSIPLNQISVIDFTPNMADYMKSADLIVSMAGYNTIVEILSLNKPAIAIPRVTPVEEQLIRAKCMEKLGLVKCIHPNDISTTSLIHEINLQLNKREETATAIQQINFNGLVNVTDSIKAMLDNKKPDLPLVVQIADQAAASECANMEAVCSAFL